MKTQVSGIFALVSAVMLSGCSTVPSLTDDDYHKSANASFREAESSNETPIEDPDLSDRLARLWADSPEVSRLLVEERDLVRAPRLIGSKTPRYPLVSWLKKARARVVLSVVIGRDGKVADARVLESSNTRFNEPALEAVRLWTFLPAESASGPEVMLILLPIRFEPRTPGVADP